MVWQVWHEKPGKRQLLYGLRHSKASSGVRLLHCLRKVNYGVLQFLRILRSGEKRGSLELRRVREAQRSKRKVLQGLRHCSNDWDLGISDVLKLPKLREQQRGLFET